MNTEGRKLGAGFCPGRQVVDSKNLGTIRALGGTLGPIYTNFQPVLWSLPIPDTSSCPPARPSLLPALTLLPCIPQTFFSRSSLWKVSRNRRTWSLRSWSILRASMARPRNSSTSSSGFRASWAPRLIMGCRFYQVHE